MWTWSRPVQRLLAPALAATGTQGKGPGGLPSSPAELLPGLSPRVCALPSHCPSHTYLVSPSPTRGSIACAQGVGSKQVSSGPAPLPTPQLRLPLATALTRHCGPL